MKKHTKEYAEKMAKKYVSDMHITDDHKAKVDYYLGYLKAIEVNAVPELIEAISYAYQAIDKKWDDGLGMHFGNQTGNIKTKKQIIELMNQALKKATE